MVRARKKENKTNQARESDKATREPDNETKKPYRGERENRTTEQRESDNETKRAEQESEGVEHPLTFGSYINNQIGK